MTWTSDDDLDQWRLLTSSIRDRDARLACVIVTRLQVFMSVALLGCPLPVNLSPIGNCAELFRSSHSSQKRFYHQSAQAFVWGPS